ncbi:sensor histidine kinase [Sediminicola luteus]|uniref:Signal transduction histidine kinase internal region domain-containing protein n=1 Tax=Sediminicola luteus TaxID=319238 RepID=A0A2A4G8E2_9FLAO|nr:sensor histidine kinase [Sediminicola luteus]PCE64897.1 hypothetical protein B7P33_06965 [Sediminicola luteus]
MKNLNPNHRPLSFNILLGIASFCILVFIFSRGERPIRIDYIYTLFFLLSVVPPVLINNYYLIPKFLKKEKLTLFILGFILNVVIFSQLNSLYLPRLLDTLFPNDFFVSYNIHLPLIVTFGIYLTLSSLLFITEDWFRQISQEKKALKLAHDEVEGQLQWLRSQINPHFLFNALNVVYAMSLKKSEHTSKALVQLSDILRYVLYESDGKWVTLNNEIALIENYIAFQKHRQYKNDQVIFTQEIENPDYRLQPMLLLPLLENAFKHGAHASNEAITIDIHLKQTQNRLVFKITNDYEVNEPNKTDKKGIGIKNLRKSLALAYPGQHELETTVEKGKYCVTLSLKPTV